jgi:predicted glycosyltransferase
MAGRLRALRGYARGRGFDVALSHASHELPMAARSLGIPSSYAFDYEFARVQHGFGCRAANRVIVPDAIPQGRLDRLGARASKVRRFPGLEEEYYLHRFTADQPWSTGSSRS